MTTPQEPQNPFSSPDAPLPPQAQHPGAYPPAPHIVVTQSSAPTTLALWATILTGAVAVFALVSAFTAASSLEETKALLENPQDASPFAGTNPWEFLSFPVLIASFVVLALWMSRLRAAMQARGDVAGGPPAVEWWGWFVPLANFVLPFLGMRAVTRGRAGIGVLVGWWVTYCLYWLTSWAAAVPSVTAVDWSTGELTNPDALDATVPLTWAAAVLLTISWVFLALVIRQATSAEKALAAQSQGLPS